MSDAKLEEMKKRIRELEEKVEGLSLSERMVVTELNRLKDKVDQHLVDFEYFSDSAGRWLDRHAGEHREINDHLYPAFFKLFPKHQGFWKEADRILEGKCHPEVDPSERTAPPDDLYKHDKWCFCPNCIKRDNEKTAREHAEHLAKTGHPKSCMCDPCKQRRLDESDRRIREEKVARGDNPDEPPPKIDPAALERNPFSDPPRPYITSNSLPKGSLVAPQHEEFCVCVECVRWRGMGPRK